MSRGILRRSVFEDQRDSERLLEGQKHRVGRFGWYLLGLLLMPSRIHHLLVPSDRMEQRDAPLCPLKEKDGDSAMSATITVTVEEAQSRLKEVIAMLAPGEEVVLTDNRQPVAKLVG